MLLLVLTSLMKVMLLHLSKAYTCGQDVVTWQHVRQQQGLLDSAATSAQCD